MAWDYPLLRELETHFKGARLRNVLLIACQHLLGPQYRMLAGLFAMGLRPQNCIVIGKNYSTNPEVIRLLQEPRGFFRRQPVIATFSTEFEPQRAFDPWFQEKLHQFLAQELSRRRLRGYRHIILLDDGGHLHEAGNLLLGQLPNLSGIEQTSSGERRIKELGIKFRRLSVARWYTKQVLEAPIIAEHACVRIISHLARRQKNNPRILVIGAGTIGRQIAGRLTNIGSVSLFDPQMGEYTDPGTLMLHSGATQVFRQQKGRLILADEVMEHLGQFEVIIGATGSNVIPSGMLDKLHPLVSLISVSSSDREFPAIEFRKGRSAELHDDYYLGNRCLVNGGFPITFGGNYHEVEPEKIELTIASLQLAILHTVTEGSYGHLPYLMGRLQDMWSGKIDGISS
jgi:hypothetical protein